MLKMATNIFVGKKLQKATILNFAAKNIYPNNQKVVAGCCDKFCCKKFCSKI
jgi:hypothetical protein